MEAMNWQSTQEAIRTCRRCEEESVAHLRVPCGEKRKPPWEPLRPARLYFVSVAPPWGGAYFWDGTQRDSLREGLFRALKDPLGVAVTTCRQFVEQRLFLTPAVKCSSEKDGKDHQPVRSAVKNCARFLQSELLAAEPERILALGRKPFEALCDIFDLDAARNVADFRKETWWVRIGSKEVPLTGTYFPGNNRHQGFEFISEDVARLLKLAPRNGNA
jgi:uracil-DNA glycosylase